jgi:hypothetical protein
MDFTVDGDRRVRRVDDDGFARIDESRVTDAARARKMARERDVSV